MRRLLLLGLVGVVGCGGPNPAPAPTSPADPAPVVPAPAADPYQLDPAQHAPPSTPAAGRLNGLPFTPDAVELEGRRLVFRQTVGKVETTLAVTLSDDVKPAEGVSAVVKPTDKWTEAKVSGLSVTTGGGEKEPKTTDTREGYALTLELGKPAEGKTAGKIQLALPGDGKNHLAGTFTAVRVRAYGEPLSAADVPLIKGSVTHPGKPGQTLSVGYAEVAGLEWVGDRLPWQVPAAGDGEKWVRADAYRPRVATLLFDKGETKFDFTKLPPGTYLLFAKLDGGPTAWVKAEVKAGDQVTRDLKLDAAAATGTVEVTTPADFAGEVRLVPTELIPADDANHIGPRIATTLDMSAKASKGKAAVANVPPGKYTMYTTPGTLAARGTVEVVAGKTATAEIKEAK